MVLNVSAREYLTAKIEQVWRSRHLMYVLGEIFMYCGAEIGRGPDAFPARDVNWMMKWFPPHTGNTNEFGPEIAPWGALCQLFGAGLIDFNDNEDIHLTDAGWHMFDTIVVHYGEGSVNGFRYPKPSDPVPNLWDWEDAAPTEEQLLNHEIKLCAEVLRVSSDLDEDAVLVLNADEWEGYGLVWNFPFTRRECKVRLNKARDRALELSKERIREIGEYLVETGAAS